jgi:hypothetical protein
VSTDPELREKLLDILIGLAVLAMALVLGIMIFAALSITILAFH